MIKNILAVILISFQAKAQNNLVIEQSWSQPYTLPFNISDGLYFSNIDGKFYSDFEILQEKSVLYPDIEESLGHAKFLEINQDLQLKLVSDSILSQQLFLKTDFRTKWSPFIHVERGYNTVDDKEGNWKNTWEISCEYEGEIFTHTFSYTSAPNKWYGVKSSLVSDEKGLNAVFLGETCLEGIFAKVYFIHFQTENKKFEIIEKQITYEDLGFDAENIQSTTKYADHEFRYKGNLGLFYRFNLDLSSALGLSTFLFDITTNSIQIHSKKIGDSIFPILDEFNEVDASIKVNDYSVDYFVRLYRCKISKGKESNTNLNSESGKDVLYLKFDSSGYSEIHNFSDTRKTYNLQKTIRLNDEFLFIYDQKPEGLKTDETVKIGNNSKFKLWLIQFAYNKTILYEIGFNYLELDQSINESYYSFLESGSSGIQIIAFLNGEMFEPNKDYLIGKINITANKRY